jgi:exoribonuclease R
MHFKEFMLLANMAVARKIYSIFPDISLLRRHPPPKEKALVELLEKSAALNFPMTGSTSAEINNWLQSHASRPGTERSVMPVLFQLVMRSMQLARYFCPGAKSNGSDELDEDDESGTSFKQFRHYALSCDL